MLLQAPTPTRFVGKMWGAVGRERRHSRDLGSRRSSINPPETIQEDQVRVQFTTLALGASRECWKWDGVAKITIIPRFFGATVLAGMMDICPYLFDIQYHH